MEIVPKHRGPNKDKEAAKQSLMNCNTDLEMKERPRAA